jgi:hypothetical protein
MVAFNELTGAGGQIGGGGALQHQQHRVGEGRGVIGHKHFTSRGRVQSLEGRGGGDDGPAGREALQHLVLYSPRQPQRGDHHHGLGEMRPDLGHRPRHLDPGEPRQRADLGCGGGADDAEDRRRCALAYKRKHVSREPERTFDIWAIIHAAGHHHQVASSRRGGRERFEINAIAHGLELVQPRGLHLPHDLAFGVGHDEGRIRAGEQPVLESDELACFTAEHPRQRPGRGRRIRSPLGRVRIDEIDK